MNFSLPVLTVALLIMSAAQRPSLAELARREAERRKEVERTGVAVKEIRSADVHTTSTTGGRAAEAGRKDHGDVSITRGADGGSLRAYRATLERLAREIRVTDERLAALRRRLDLEMKKQSTIIGGRRDGSAADKLRAQAGDLEQKLRRLQGERRIAYEEGRRAGWQPGELDGRYVVR